MKRGEDEMKTNMKKSILILLVTLLFAVMLSACGKDKIDMERFEVNLKYGYGNSLRMGSYAPFYIDVTNHGKDFGGTIQLMISARAYPGMMNQRMEIPVRHLSIAIPTDAATPRARLVPSALAEILPSVMVSTCCFST